MKKAIFYTILTSILFSCIQNYPNKYIEEVDKICSCFKVTMDTRESKNEHTKFIAEDKVYQDGCILDAIINEVDTKGEEFKNAIDDLCPELNETHQRYLDGI